MKNLPSFHRIVAGLASVVFAFMAISCQTATPPAADVTKGPTQSHWVKVSSQPPTYYPRGVAADHPTDHWSGEWVDTGDDHGTRYFIPFRELGGIDRQRLVNEALSARSERKLAAIADEDEEIRLRNIRNVAFYGPPVYAGLLLAAMGGATSFEVDVHRLEKEWYSSKGLH
jgi:hypothetical protein